MPAPGLPPIEIKPSRMVALYVATLVAIPVLITIVVPLLSGESVGPRDALGALGVLGVLVAIAAPVIALMLRAQVRTRARLLAQAPAGTVLATLATPLEVQDADAPKRFTRFSGWTNGVLVIGEAGISFRKKRTDPAMPEVRFRWDEIERLETERENPFRLFLRVHTRTRQIHAWQVPGAPTVEAALRRLRDGA